MSKIVYVFSQFAPKSHLEDIFKIIDAVGFVGISGDDERLRRDEREKTLASITHCLILSTDRDVESGWVQSCIEVARARGWKHASVHIGEPKTIAPGSLNFILRKQDPELKKTLSNLVAFLMKPRSERDPEGRRGELAASHGMEVRDQADSSRPASGDKRRKPGRDTTIGFAINISPQSSPDRRSEPEEPESEPDEKISETIESLADSIRREMNRSNVVLLLAQAGSATTQSLQQAWRLLSSKYPQGQAWLIRPLSSQDATREQYFDRLGRDCGFPRVRSAADFEEELRKRVDFGPAFLMIRGLENGSGEWREELARILRGLMDDPPTAGKINILLSGGQRLAALKYALGIHSLLNNAPDLLWPDSRAEDLLLLAEKKYPKASLDSRAAAEILNFCGGQPLLIEKSLEYYEMSRQSEDAPPEQNIYRDSSSISLFTPFLDNPTLKNQVCESLSKETLGNFTLWPADPVVRDLFWKNLLREKDGVLEWRGVMLRQTGRMILGCP